MFSDRHKVEILKVCFLMPRGVVATVTCQTCTNAHFFSMGLKRSSTCSFVHLKMHKCTNAQFLAFDGTPSQPIFFKTRSIKRTRNVDLSHSSETTFFLVPTHQLVGDSHKRSTTECSLSCGGQETIYLDRSDLCKDDAIFCETSAADGIVCCSLNAHALRQSLGFQQRGHT